MGEIAEMMLEGCLCQSCGEYLGDGDGYPVTCDSCQRPEVGAAAPAGKPVQCAHCTRRFKDHAAYLDHYRAKHDANAK